MTRLVIGVIGSAGDTAPGSVVDILDVAERVGAAVATAGAVLVSGGTTGVMAAASRGAREAGGLTIGFLPDADRSRASEFVDVAFPTGMGTIRNLLTPRVCDAVVMIGGGAGTLNELTIAYDFGTPVVAVEGTGGWADRIRSVLHEGRWLDERRTVALSFAKTPEDAVAQSVRRASEPRRFTSLPVHSGSAAG
ncbi:TIGR00725 family protein [Microbacterium sp. SLBN-111]|uniref:TIGR00725 family protein n=1 Tax=Microbacterium sp. SLBN-111 TaxID=3377733 RepID=UPI003C7724DE